MDFTLDLQEGLFDIQAWLLVLSLLFLGFGLGFDLEGAGLSHAKVSWHWAFTAPLLGCLGERWCLSPHRTSPVLKLVLVLSSKLLPVAWAPCTGCSESGPHRHLRGSPHADVDAGGAGPPGPLWALPLRTAFLHSVFLFGHCGGEPPLGEEGGGQGG